VSAVHAIPTIRRSLAEGLATCPAFRMERSERLAFGQAAHQFIAAYWRHLQALREETDMSGWQPLAVDAWARTTGLAQSRFHEYMGLCERFVGSHLGELHTLAAVEEPITHHVGWGILVCTPDRIDRIDGGDPDDDATAERIVDYKTEMGEMDHLFQLSWYAQMRFLTRPALQRLDLVLDLVRWGRPHDPITIERGELDAWWDATLQALRHRLDAGPGAPVGGPACEGCALRRTCGESLPSVAIAPETEEEADELLAEHRRLDEAAKVRWGLLEEWYRDRPARPEVHGEEIGYLETREDSFELLIGASQMRLFAALSGMDPDALVAPVTPSNKGLRERLVELELARFYRKPPVFKTRKAMVGTRVRRPRTEEAGDA
jgi:hypothetical protein